MIAVGEDDLVHAVGVADFAGGKSGREGQELARFQRLDEVGALAHGGTPLKRTARGRRGDFRPTGLAHAGFAGNFVTAGPPAASLGRHSREVGMGVKKAVVRAAEAVIERLEERRMLSVTLHEKTWMIEMKDDR